MRRLVFVTQTLDPEDPRLGIVPAYLEALAREVDEIFVIANEVLTVPAALEGKAISLGKERKYGRMHRTVRYESAVTRLLSHRGPTVLLAHMCPVYLNLAAPIAYVTGARTMLWYAHPADTPRLRLAERLADAVLTTTRPSYPRSSPRSNRKLHLIGQGIDVSAFPYSAPKTDGSKLRILAVGRIGPEKGLTTLVEAAAMARQKGIELDVRIVGPATLPEEQRVRVVIENLIDTLDLRSVVSIEPPVNYKDMPALLAGSTVIVSASAEGCADKTVFEAAASGRPVVAASSAVGPLLRDLPVNLTFTPEDAAGLADRLVELAGTSDATLEVVGTELRHRVELDHSNAHWAREVVAVADELWACPVARRVRPRGRE